MAKAQDIINSAFIEIGAYAPGDVPAAEEISFGLEKLNRLLDSWAANKALIYTVDFLTSFLLTPNLQPHTIGPSGSTPPPTFVITGLRPQRIASASLILNDVTPNVYEPLNIRDKDWWAAQQVPGLATTNPTDLYYQASYPNGEIFLWPKPTQAYGLQLEIWQQLQSSVALTTEMVFPPGYQDAVTYALAVSLLPAGEKNINPALVLLAKRAMDFIEGNNFPTPRMSTKDSGIPTSGIERRSSFNWLTGRSV